MILKDLITALRWRLDDLVGTSSDRLWSDGELTSYIDTVQFEIADECRVIKDTSVSFSLLTGSSSVDLGRQVSGLDRAVLIITSSGKRVVLNSEGIGVPTIDDLIEDGSWPSPKTGIPSRIVAIDSDGHYVLDRALSEPATLDVVTTKLTSPGVLSIPEKYHQRLMNGVLMWCFTKPDTETYSAAKRDFYAKLYDHDKEMVRRAEKRLSPKRLTYVVS